MNASERQDLYRREYHAQLARMAPNCPGNRFSYMQIARAKGLATKRTLEVVDAQAS